MVQLTLNCGAEFGNLGYHQSANFFYGLLEKQMLDNIPIEEEESPSSWSLCAMWPRIWGYPAYTHNPRFLQKVLVPYIIKIWLAVSCSLTARMFFFKMVKKECQKDTKGQTKRSQLFGCAYRLNDLEAPKYMCVLRMITWAWTLCLSRMNIFCGALQALGGLAPWVLVEILC